MQPEEERRNGRERRCTGGAADDAIAAGRRRQLLDDLGAGVKVAGHQKCDQHQCCNLCHGAPRFCWALTSQLGVRGERPKAKALLGYLKFSRFRFCKQ